MKSAKLCFLGASHAAVHLRQAASDKGFAMVAPELADVVFVSQDTPIDESGQRDVQPIRELVAAAVAATWKSRATLVITSQVEPGFTRSLNIGAFHQSETLRMSDSAERAANPEQMIVGSPEPEWLLPEAYREYLAAFVCPILVMTLEAAEFAKIAINMALASQVDYANRMKAACDKIGVDWLGVRETLRLDQRIGRHAYLRPGRWQDSQHLLRDYVTLQEIENRGPR